MDYRTTLGHKVNHKFKPDCNTEFMAVKHALFGPICSLGMSSFLQLKFISYNVTFKTMKIILKMIEVNLKTLLIVATKVIEKDEELFVDYDYDVDATAGEKWSWYREAKKLHLQQLEGQDKMMD